MARTNNLTNFLTDVSSAIKQKTGDSTPITAADFDTEILSIPTQGAYQNKEITISQNGTVTLLPDTGYDAMSSARIITNVEDAEYQVNLALSTSILGTNVLPYIELEYIQSTGTQYIDLDYTFNNNCKFILEGSNFSGLSVMHGSDLYTSRGAGISINAGNLYWSYVGDMVIISSVTSSNLKYTIEIQRNLVTVNNTVVSSDTSVNTTTTFTPIRLFRARPNNNYSSYKLYSFKIYENDVLVKNYIPARSLLTNEVGLYETISEQWFYNAGTGTFIAGPEVE